MHAIAINKEREHVFEGDQGEGYGGGNLHIILNLEGVVEAGFLCSFGACLGTSFCLPGWPQTHKDPSASASQVLRLKVCTTTALL